MHRDSLNRLLSARTIIKAAELELIVSAEQLLAQARQQADQLLEQAHQQASAIGAQARLAAQNVFDQERERGFAHGMRQAQEAQARQVAGQQAALAKSWQEQDGKMSHLVLRTLSKILTEADAEQQFFASVTRRVLRVARDQRFLVFKVSPTQLEAARTSIQAVIAQTGAPNFIDVVAQADLPTGACVIETEHSQINASLDAQLGAIEQALLAAFPPRSADGSLAA